MKIKKQKLALFLIYTTSLIIYIQGCGSTIPTTEYPQSSPIVSNYISDTENSDSKNPEDQTVSLTDHDIILMVIKSDPTLEALAWELKALEAEVLQAGFTPNPEVSVELEQVIIQGYELTEGSVGYAHPIELGGKRDKRVALANQQSNLAAWDLEKRRLNIITTARLAHLALLYWQESLVLADELLDLDKQVTDSVKEKLDAGDIPPFAVTRAEVNLKRSQATRNDVSASLTGARYQLAALWGGKPEFKSVTGDFYGINKPPALDSLYDFLDRNPEVAQTDTEIEGKLAEVTLSESNALPDLTLEFAIRYVGDITNPAIMFGASIPLPLFDKKEGEIRAAKHRVEETRARGRAVRREAKSQLVEAWVQLSRDYDHIVTIRDSILVDAKSVMEQTLDGYREGNFDYIEVLDIQRTVIELRLEYLEILYRYHNNKIFIENLTAGHLFKDSKDQK